MSDGNEHQAAVGHRAIVEKLWTKPILDEINPIASVPDASSVLVAECRCGLVPSQIVGELPPDARVIALDPSRAMLDQARERLPEDASGRVFFVPQRVDDLAYADEVFRASICFNGIVTIKQAKDGISELARVTGPGGTVNVAAPLGTSFPQFYDMLDEALRAHKLHDVLRRMYELRDSFLTASRLVDIAEKSNLVDPVVHELSWQVSFDSGQALLFSPLVRETFFNQWIGIIRSSDREPILRYIADAIDTYWHEREFRCDIVAGCLTALR